MSWSRSLILTANILILVVICFIIQIVSLTTSHWATFNARTEIGKPKETGHYGLWNLCVTRLPHYVEDCNPLDTFFQAPQYLQVAGALGIVHVLQLSSLFLLKCLGLIQLLWKTSDFVIRSKVLSIVTVVIAFIAVIFSILVAILASVDESKSAEYVITKGWSFWMQISVIVIDVIMTVLCGIHSFLFWYLHIKENADPMGHHAETYRNPYRENNASPEIASEINQNLDLHNADISYTNASGVPYAESTMLPKVLVSHGIQKSSIDSLILENRDVMKTHKIKQEAANHSTSGILTYENPSFQEHSPSIKRCAS